MALSGLPNADNVFVIRELKNVSARCNMNRHRLHVFYSGRVQGIGFRYTTRMLARGFEVTGVVRNLPDSRVELIAEGDRTELEAFAQAVRDSELGHFIRQEDVRWDDVKNEFHGFEIVR